MMVSNKAPVRADLRVKLAPEAVCVWPGQDATQSTYWLWPVSKRVATAGGAVMQYLPYTSS